MMVRMAERRRKRPRDPLALAKMIGDIATGQTSDTEPDTRNQAAVELGRLGGKRGGRARADKMTPERRKEIAQKAAQKRTLKFLQSLREISVFFVGHDDCDLVLDHLARSTAADFKLRTKGVVMKHSGRTDLHSF
jgi:hypothetical protein